MRGRGDGKGGGRARELRWYRPWASLHRLRGDGSGTPDGFTLIDRAIPRSWNVGQSWFAGATPRGWSCHYSKDLCFLSVLEARPGLCIPRTLRDTVEDRIKSYSLIATDHQVVVDLWNTKR